MNAPTFRFQFLDLLRRAIVLVNASAEIVQQLLRHPIHRFSKFTRRLVNFQIFERLIMLRLNLYSFHRFNASSFQRFIASTILLNDLLQFLRHFWDRIESYVHPPIVAMPNDCIHASKLWIFVWKIFAELRSSALFSLDRRTSYRFGN